MPSGKESKLKSGKVKMVIHKPVEVRGFRAPRSAAHALLAQCSWRAQCAVVGVVSDVAQVNDSKTMCEESRAVIAAELTKYGYEV